MRAFGYLPIVTKLRQAQSVAAVGFARRSNKLKELEIEPFSISTNKLLFFRKSLIVLNSRSSNKEWLAPQPRFGVTQTADGNGLGETIEANAI